MTDEEAQVEQQKAAQNWKAWNARNEAMTAHRQKIERDEELRQALKGGRPWWDRRPDRDRGRRETADRDTLDATEEDGPPAR